MARLAASPYPLPALTWGGRYEDTAQGAAMAALEATSAALPDGEVVGALLRFQVADGYATYLVTQASPLTVQLVPAIDSYTVQPALIRGLNKRDVLNQLAQRKGWARLFNKSK